MGLLSFFSAKPAQAPVQPIDVFEPNPALGGVSFMHHVVQQSTTDEMVTFRASYGPMNTAELDIFSDHMAEIEFNEDMAHYAQHDAVVKATEFCTRIWGRDHPDFLPNYKRFLYDDIQNELVARQHIAAMSALSAAEIERSERRHAEMISALDNVKQNDSLYSDAKSLATQHPFLVGLLGHATITKIFSS